MRIVRRLRYLWNRRQRENQLREEIEEHISIHIDDLIEKGLSPEDAELRARRRFGNAMLIREQSREVWVRRWIDNLRNDVRLSFRRFAKKRVTFLACVLTVGTGLGATIAVYGLVSGLLYSPPSGITSPEEVLIMWAHDANVPDGIGTFNSAQYFEIADAQDVFTGLAAFHRRPGVVSSRDGSDYINLERVSGNYFQTLGVDPVLGRILLPADDLPGAPSVAVVSHSYWTNRLGGDPDVLGSRLRLNEDTDLEVVGVAPEGFAGLIEHGYWPPDVWLTRTPFGLGPLWNDRTDENLQLVGRLRPGVGAEDAAARLGIIVGNISIEPSDYYQPDGAILMPASESRLAPGYSRRVARQLLSVLTAVAVVTLLASCFGAANFGLADGISRQSELATRFALGAARGRILGQLLTESTLMAVVAGGLGLLLARGLVDLAALLRPATTVGQGLLVALDAGRFFRWDMIAFSGAIVLGTILLTGLLPALWISFRNPWDRIRGVWPLARGERIVPRELLLVVQVSLAVVIGLIAAVYLLNSNEVARADPGYPTDSVLLGQVFVHGVPSEEREAFYRVLFDRLNGAPGVVSASIGWNEPFAPAWGSVSSPETRDTPIEAGTTSVAPRFFETYRIPIIAGREFNDTETDRDAAAIVNHILAERLWPGENPIGQTLLWGNPPQLELPVVGVTAVDRCRDLVADPHPCYWRPFPRTGSGWLRVRTQGAPEAFEPRLVDLLRSVDSGAAIHDIKTEERHLANLTMLPRMSAALTSVLAAVVVGLMGFGSYGLAASTLNARLREIAIRKALGATSARLILAVGGRTIVLLAAGVMLGLVLSPFADRAVQVQLADFTEWTGPHDVQTAGAWVFGTVAAVVFGVGSASVLLSLRRPLRIPPIEILRRE